MKLPFQAQIETKAYTLYQLARAGFIKPERPDNLVRLAQVLIRWGATPAAGAKANAIRYPDDTGMIDEAGELTFAEIHRRSNALASAMSDRHIGEGDGVAILTRNHRYFLDATIACSKLGAKALLMNTSFAPPQAREVLEREKPRATIYDGEFSELIDHATRGRRTRRFVAFCDDEEKGIEGDELIDDLIVEGDTEDVVAPTEEGRLVILTSGTTGTPKGASRSAPKGIDPIGGLLGRVPYRVRETMFIAPPLFHAWGVGQLMIGTSFADTIVVQNKFNPEATLKAIDEHRPEILVVVPVMLSRILALPQETRAKYDTSSLRIVFASGSALPGELAKRWMDAYGDNLYNLYGSTEVAWATIATPDDLRKAPGTAGKPPQGTTVVIVDKDGKPVPQGETGRIFVGNEMVFEGYTGGGSKEILEGLMSTGDMGHIDDEGRLFIDSREDDMIVSGGENVYPGEVEELLSNHPAVDDVAVIGVEDDEFGQRLKAVIVTAGGKQLSEDEVKGYVKEHLARYKVPRDVEFLDELPRNATGKVLKRELK